MKESYRYDRAASYSVRRPVKKRRRKRSKAPGVVIFLLLFLCALLTTFCFILYMRIPQPRRDMLGEWSATEDMTETAAEAAQLWLNGAALGGNISVRDFFDSEGARLNLSTRLKLSGDGGYELTLDEASYERAKKTTCVVTSAALLELIRVRLKAAGADESQLTDEILREAFLSALDSSPEEYLRLYGPRMLPDLMDMQRVRNKEGRFKLDAENSFIIWDGESRDAFVLNGDLLVLRGAGLNKELADSDGRLFLSRVIDTDEEVYLINPFSPLKVQAKEHRITENLMADAGSGAVKVVKAVHSDYKNNRFLSLRDLGGALEGTEREFSLSISGSGIVIDTSGTFTAVGGENEPFPTDDLNGTTSWTTNDLKANAMTIDGRSVKYYTFLAKNTAGKFDCFINLTDFSLLFDINVSVSDGVLSIDASERTLIVDMENLEKNGFYDEMKSAVLGDATTGEIITGSNENIPVPVASTTKLLSLAVIMDAMASGEISMDDEVIISKAVADLSQSSDRVIPMETGEKTNVTELLHAMLIASSNESAKALAEHVSGSEEEFAKRMTKKAEELGFKDGYAFYNCNGLPVFADSVSTAKMQNHMSARDMFLLSSYLLNVYPQITDITSMKTDSLYSLKMDIKTTNSLLYNMPEVVGLKTGTTNMAGGCLVAALKTGGADGKTHDIVSVVFGAEDNTVRFTSSALMLSYGRQVVKAGEVNGERGSALDADIPTDAESVVRRVIDVIRGQ